MYEQIIFPLGAMYRQYTRPASVAVAVGSLAATGEGVEKSRAAIESADSRCRRSCGSSSSSSSRRRLRCHEHNLPTFKTLDTTIILFPLAVLPDFDIFRQANSCWYFQNRVFSILGKFIICWFRTLHPAVPHGPTAMRAQFPHFGAVVCTFDALT